MSSGGGAQGETRYNWNDDMAPRWNNLLNSAMWQGFTQNADGSMQVRPRATYDQQRFTPLQYDQTAAGSNIRSLNDQSYGTIQAGNAARNQITNTLNGGGMGSNPYANIIDNPFIGGNQYMGEGPAFNAMMGDVMGDMAEAYRQGTAADLTRSANMSGAFGGSAHQQAIANNEAALAKAMGQTANQMRSAQFDKSAGLMENQLNRGFQNYNQGIDRGYNAHESERNRQIQAIGAGQAEQGMALQRAGAQMDYGNLVQQQGQKQNDFNFDQWSQAQNHPYAMLQMLSGLYGQAMGGGGMNQSIYGGQGSNLAPYLGAGLMAASMFAPRS